MKTKESFSAEELIEACNQKAGFPSGTALLIFNDIKANNVDKLVAQDFPTGRLGQIHLDLFDGDLIVFQKALSPQEEQLFPLSTVKEFFKFVLHYPVMLSHFSPAPLKTD